MDGEWSFTVLSIGKTQRNGDPKYPQKALLISAGAIQPFIVSDVGFLLSQQKGFSFAASHRSTLIFDAAGRTIGDSTT